MSEQTNSDLDNFALDVAEHISRMSLEPNDIVTVTMPEGHDPDEQELAQIREKLHMVLARDDAQVIIMPHGMTMTKATDPEKLAALLDRAENFIDKIIHERARDNRRAQEELEAMGHSVLMDDDMMVEALRLRGELVKAMGELRRQEPKYGVSPVAKARETFETAEAISKSRWEEFKAVVSPTQLERLQQLEAYVEQRTAEIKAEQLTLIPEVCVNFTRVKEPSGDSDVAALAEAAQTEPQPLDAPLGNFSFAATLETCKKIFCPQGHHTKSDPCRSLYCSCRCPRCRQQCEEGER